MTFRLPFRNRAVRCCENLQSCGGRKDWSAVALSHGGDRACRAQQPTGGVARSESAPTEAGPHCHRLGSASYFVSIPKTKTVPTRKSL